MNRENSEVISTITVAEVLTGFYLARDEEKTEKMKNLLQDLSRSGLKVVPFTFEIADLSARLRAGGRLPDALIVATAIDQAVDMVYSNDEDLRRFSEEVKISKIE